MDLEYSLYFLYSQLDFIHYPGTSEGAILILGMRTFRIGGVNACSTQAKH